MPRVKAKRVVLFYFEANDLTNLSDELNNVKLSNYLNDKNYTQNLHLKQDIIDLLGTYGKTGDVRKLEQLNEIIEYDPTGEARKGQVATRGENINTTIEIGYTSFGKAFKCKS